MSLGRSSASSASWAFPAGEAGNLTAYLKGIRPIQGGWTASEFERLLFMRHLVGRGSIEARLATAMRGARE